MACAGRGGQACGRRREPRGDGCREPASRRRFEHAADRLPGARIARRARRARRARIAPAFTARRPSRQRNARATQLTLQAMDLVQRVVELLADASGRDLRFVALRLQSSDRLSRALAILRQFLRGSFELRTLGLLQLQGVRSCGLSGLYHLKRAGRWVRLTALHQSWRKFDLRALLELREPPAQRFEREITLLQFELLFVEQFDQK